MRKLPKKWRTDFAKMILKIMNDMDLEITDYEEFGLCDAGPFATGNITTPFGPVSFSLYDDWVAMQLKYHPGFVDNRCKWFKFDHWKVNFNTFAGVTKPKDRPSPDSFLAPFERHLDRFFNGTLPTEEEFEKYKSIQDKKDKAWRKAKEEWYASQKTPSESK